MYLNNIHHYVAPDIEVMGIDVEQGFQLSNHLWFEVEDWDDGDGYYGDTGTGL